MIHLALKILVRLKTKKKHSLNFVAIFILCELLKFVQVERIPPLGDGAPLHWKFSDNQTVLCDQGYGSERSPEEEYPPPLPDHDTQCHHHLEPHACYPFVTPGISLINYI